MSADRQIATPDRLPPGRALEESAHERRARRDPPLPPHRDRAGRPEAAVQKASTSNVDPFGLSRPDQAKRRRVRLRGVELDNITASETIDRIVSDLRAGRGGWVLTPNLDILRALSRDPQYALLCSATSLRVADGMPLLWASRLQGTPLVERVAGSDLIWTLTARAAEEGRSVFFLGGNPGAAESAAARLKELNPGLRVVGTECPPIGFEGDGEYNARMRAKLSAAAPDICFVALGLPKQDRLIRSLMPLLPATWFLGVGISFSFVSGEVRRAPRWMRLSGLEWLHRLVQEPRRLGRRYLVHGVPFALGLLAESAAAGLTGATRRPEGAPEVSP